MIVTLVYKTGGNVVAEVDAAVRLTPKRIFVTGQVGSIRYLEPVGTKRALYVSGKCYDRQNGKRIGMSSSTGWQLKAGEIARLMTVTEGVSNAKG